MKTRSIREKILLPIIIMMGILALFTILRSQFIIQKISKHYEESMVSNDMTIFFDLLKNTKSLNEVKNKLLPTLKKEGYEYRIVVNGREAFKSGGFNDEITLPKKGIVVKGNSTGSWGFRYYHEPWNAEFVVLKHYSQLASIRRELNANTSLFLFSVLLMILFVIIILRKNLSEPIKGIMYRIGRGECAVPTNITELDELVETINDALATAEVRQLQADTLHSIAVSLNEDRTLDELMDGILEKSRILIHADLSAIALYDEKGNFKHLKVYGLDGDETMKKIGRLPKGEGLLKLMRFSMAPVRVNDLASHPAFSGRFPEGHPFIKNFLGYPIFSKEGRPLGSLYFANKKIGDFTEEDEEILMAIASDAAVAIQRIDETSELARFKQIIESSFDVIVVTDTAGNITYVNPSFEQVTGYSSDEVVGKNPRILKSGFHDEEFYRQMWETISSGKPWKGEFVNRKKDGELYTASAIIFPLIEKGKIINYISIQRDISEEKKLYEQLLRAQKMEAIGTLAGGIAHDFNNILSAVLGYAEILRDEIPKDEKLMKSVNIIEQSAKRGASLARKILNVTRKEKLELKMADINVVVEETLELLKRSIPKDIDIRIKLNREIPEVRIDPGQIQQVIMNLIINARDAMPDGGTITVTTDLVGAENGAANGVKGESGFVKVSVSDTGSGISKDMQSKIFDPFFTTKEQGRGTGLGLYIVYSIVTNHGGYINLYSEPNKGTRFNIYLPVLQGDTEREDTREIEDLRGDGSVLVIDDEEHLRELMKDYLEPLGYHVLTAPDGREGVRVFSQKRDEIDLVILDMIMPGMNGAEVFQQIRSLRDDVKVLICSGYSHEGLAGIRELIKQGASGFVQKPFSKITLARKVKEAIGR